MTNVPTMDSNGSEFSPARERAAILPSRLPCPQTTWTSQTLAARLRRLWAGRKPVLRRFDDLQSAVMVEGAV
jgi:hypothetical protein